MAARFNFRESAMYIRGETRQHRVAGWRLL